MANLHIKKGDTVVVLSGDDKGVIGEVIAASRAAQAAWSSSSVPPPFSGTSAL